jgi:hypothetical protein
MTGSLNQALNNNNNISYYMASLYGEALLIIFGHINSHVLV